MLMALIDKRYDNYYKPNTVTGHVFEKWFYEKRIDDKEGMLKVTRYIHLNSLRKIIVKREKK